MLSQPRILVVEDDPQVAEIIQYNLCAAGYSVTVVEDGVGALRVFDAARPALVTIDLNVPSVSGFRLVELFKRHAPEIPVIVVTALSFEEAEETARSGADDFVAKPFDPQQLVKKVGFHLVRPRTFPSPTSPPSNARLPPAVPLEIA